MYKYLEKVEILYKIDKININLNSNKNGRKNLSILRIK